jgi:hypothetical protein
MTRVRILFHKNCFDGIVSAALFTAFYKECLEEKASFSYVPKQHGQSPIFTDQDFSGEVNACVDFRYSPDPRLHWWFDHHASAFETPEAQHHFETKGIKTHFYDPTRLSNGKFLADTCHAQFGFETKRFKELLEWVEIIDGACFPDPHMAVEMKEPALQLMMWVENNNNTRYSERLIRELQKYSLAEILRKKYIQKTLARLLERHQRHLELFQRKIQICGDVAFFDLSDEPVKAYNKFIVYHFYEKILYTVGVSRFPKHCKVSVGSNPWQRERRRHHIARLCEKYGGGGHPVVGAISYPANDCEKAKSTAQEIIKYLNQPDLTFQ